ncbi:SET domain-containing protein [Athelia psychrophila]|uniref:Histone-lysine N-methyltransferase, H3 lysine-36 specific n=1 Tax=Athelia psychrophila TaxID=1759441 RepID=A0A166W1E8_9AGAM|nr:SET domain-containing protein [Fibularhizoctonia sp. CBS 109695]
MNTPEVVSKPQSPVVEEASVTPPPVKAVKPERKGPQLIGDLPIATEEALRTFIPLPGNHYQYSTLGRTRETLESMTCDCQYEHGVDRPTEACGHDSDCINRLTQVECMSDDCRCRSYCLNQRFQQKKYAPIDVVLTEKKGYGIRAADDIRKDEMIYEYIGDVVSHTSFMKRMRDYAAEGLQHFYFMMLQKEEYIDATKRGGIGRFLNHSCAPNCYVAKWSVGIHVRMGIFASRKVQKNEELTFNYNVDRYGHEAQPCYCGEPKCVGFIGGKTQTDIGGMDELYIEALGISDEVDKFALKGNKKKKGRKLDEDYMPILKPIVEKEVPKVVQAMRQTQSRKVLSKLLTRVKITEDQSALRQLMRLRGFSLMTNILDDYVKDGEIITLALESMLTWPLLHRNKVEDSRVHLPVSTLATSDDDERIKSLAQRLIDHWGTLETAYRIPKRLKDGDEDDSGAAWLNDNIDELRPIKRLRHENIFSGEFVTRLELPAQMKVEKVEDPAEMEAALDARMKAWSCPPMPQQRQPPTKKDIAAIIAAASAAEAARAAEATAAAAAASQPPVEAAPKKKSKPPRKTQTHEEKEANKEKRLMKLVGTVVVKCMSKHSKQMDTTQFKKHAKELTKIIADKEKKSSSYKEGKLDSLSDEKIVKIKKFAKDYITKVLHKIEKAKKHKSSSSAQRNQAASSASAETPDSPGDPETANGNTVEMTVEEAMDLGESDSEGEAEDEHEDDPMNVDPPPTHNAMADEATAAWSNSADLRAQHGSWDRDRGPNPEVSVES